MMMVKKKWVADKKVSALFSVRTVVRTLVIVDHVSPQAGFESVQNLILNMKELIHQQKFLKTWRSNQKFNTTRTFVLGHL